MPDQQAQPTVPQTPPPPAGYQLVPPPPDGGELGHAALGALAGATESHAASSALPEDQKPPLPSGYTEVAPPVSKWDEIKQAFTGPTTAAGTPMPPQFQQEGSGASDVLHGNIRQGIGKIWAAEAPHVIPGSPLERMIQKIDPTFKGAAPSEPVNPLNQPLVDAAQFIDKQQHPILKALTEAGQSLTSPGNIAIMTATGGLGLVDSPKSLAMANRLLSAGFSANMIGHAYQYLDEFKKAYDSGDASEAEYQLTHALASGTIATVAAAHAAGVDLPVAGKPEKAVASKIGSVVKQPIESVMAAKEKFNPSSLGENVRRMSLPPKNTAAEYSETLVSAEPQLRDIFRENPNVKSPQDVADAIQNRIDTTESQLSAQARQIESTPGFPPDKAIIPDASKYVDSALDDYFTEHRGAYTPEQIQAAKDQIQDRIVQGGGQGESEVRDSSLFEAENLRKQLNKETQVSFGEGAVPSATRDAKVVAVAALRNLIDQKYEELGVGGVKEWRQQEAPLIRVKEQLVKGFAKAEEMGNWNLIRSAISNVRTGALGFGLGAILGMESSGVTGAMLEAGSIARDYASDLLKNPNRATVRAAKIATREPAPTNVAKPSISTPASPTPTPTPTPQGGHAGGGVASVEELNRPGIFVKISRLGMPTYMGKSPDFGEMKPGEAGYQIKPDGTIELRAGTETPATKQAAQKYHSDIHGKVEAIQMEQVKPGITKYSARVKGKDVTFVAPSGLNRQEIEFQARAYANKSNP